MSDGTAACRFDVDCTWSHDYLARAGQRARRFGAYPARLRSASCTDLPPIIADTAKQRRRPR